MRAGRVGAEAFSRPPADALLALWAVSAWLMPHVQTNVSVYRGEAALLPLAALLGRLPRSVQFAVAAAAVGLAVPMARRFFNHQLI